MVDQIPESLLPKIDREEERIRLAKPDGKFSIISARQILRCKQLVVALV